jgi:hypothetical protein
MVAQDPVGPAALRQGSFIFADDASNLAGVPGRLDQLEIERQVGAGQLLAVIGDEALERQIDLADQHPVGIGVDDLPHLGNDAMHLGPVRRVDLEELPDAGITRAVARVGGIVAECVILDEVPHDVDAETVDAAVEPEAKDLEHGVADLAITPVQVGLLLEEAVVVVLTRRLVPLPG